MPSLAYEYRSDDGNTYQVVLPSDFASALGYIPASGTESYLPSYISMRYATFQSLSGLYLNAVYITSPFNSINPPLDIVVSGIEYLLKTAYGEQRGNPPFPGILTIAGPPGPPGQNGSGGVAEILAGTGIGVSAPTGNVTVSNTGVTSLTAGTGISLSGSTGSIAISNTSSFSLWQATSSLLTIALNTNITFAHGLGRLPQLVRVVMVCQIADAGYALGNVVDWLATPDAYGSGASVGTGYSMETTTTQAVIVMNQDGNGPWLINKSTGAPQQITIGSWKAQIFCA